MTEPDHPDSGSNPSSFASLRAYPGNPFLISEIVCQECEETRPNIKSHNVIHLVYLVVFAYWRWDTHVKCPSCMRSYLCRRFLPALLLANFASPIIVVWWGVSVILPE